MRATTTLATATLTPTAHGVRAATPESGPNFFTLDIRLMRQFPLGLDKNIQVVAEAFNLLNRTNFRHVNSTVGKLRLEELPTSLKGRRGPVTEPFSFTSAFDPRQFQFSLRLNF